MAEARPGGDNSAAAVVADKVEGTHYPARTRRPDIVLAGIAEMTDSDLRVVVAVDSIGQTDGSTAERWEMWRLESQYRRCFRRARGRAYPRERQCIFPGSDRSWIGSDAAVVVVRFSYADDSPAGRPRTRAQSIVIRPGRRRHRPRPSRRC